MERLTGAGAPLLSARDLAVGHGARALIRGIGFDLYAGGFCAFWGRTGQGKPRCFAPFWG